MKKMKKSVKAILIASVSLVCVAAIVLGCVFGLKKDKTPSTPEPPKTNFTAAQKLLAQEIEENSVKMGYSIYDAVPYKDVCSYDKITRFGKNYFAFKDADSQEEFYTYKISEDGTVETDRLTDPAINFIDTVSGTESYSVKAIKENYVVLKTAYKQNAESAFAEEKYSLVYFGEFGSPVEIFSYSSKGKEVQVIDFELKENYFIFSVITNCDVTNGIGDLEIYYNFYTTEVSEETPVQKLVTKYYHQSETQTKYFSYNTYSNMFTVQADDVLKVVYLRYGTFVTYEIAIEKSSAGALLNTYEIDELTNNKFIISKITPVTEQSNVKSTSVILSSSAAGNSYVDYEYVIYDYTSEVAKQTKLTLEKGTAKVIVPTRDENLKDSFYLTFQKIEENSLVEKYIVCYFDKDLNQVVKFESTTPEKIEQTGKATFVTSSQILKANETTKMDNLLTFGETTYQTDGKLENYFGEYIVINKMIDNTNYYGLMKVDGTVVAEPAEVKFIKVYDIVGDVCFVSTTINEYYQYNIKTKELSTVENYEYDSVVNSKNLGLFVKDDGTTKVIDSISEGVVFENVSSFVGTESSAKNMVGGVYFEVNIGGETPTTKLMHYAAINRDNANYATMFTTPGNLGDDFNIEDTVERVSNTYGSASFTFNDGYGSGTFTQSKNPEMTINMANSHYLYSASIGLKFFNEYTLSISGLSWVPADSSNYIISYSYSGDLVTAPYAYMSNYNIVYYCRFSYSNVFGYGGTGFESLSGTVSQAYFYVFACYLPTDTTFTNSTAMNRVNTFTNGALASTLIANGSVNATTPGREFDINYGHITGWRVFGYQDGSTTYFKNYFDPSAYSNSNTVTGVDYNFNYVMSLNYNRDWKVVYALYTFIYAKYEVNEYTLSVDGSSKTYSVLAYTNQYAYGSNKTGYTWSGYQVTGADSSLTHTVKHYNSSGSVVKTETYTGDTFTIAPVSGAVGITLYGLEKYHDYTTTMTSQFTPVVYTATLNKQNGTGGADAVYEHYGIGVYKESSLLTKITTSANAISNPTRTGYTFNGYYTSTGGSGTKILTSSGYLNTNSSTSWSSNTTLYASWTPISYTVKYYTSPTATTTKTVAYDTVVNVPAVSKDFYWFNGYDITGCTNTCTHYYGSTSAANSGYFSGVSKTLGAGYYYFKNLRSSSGTVTITPQFVANTYTVTYNANNGYFSDSTQTQTITASYDSSYTIPSVTRTGYTYAGWVVSGMDTETTHYFYGSATSSSTDASITLDSTKTSYKNLRGTAGTVTFEARWTANKYNISYNLGAGSWMGTETHPSSATYDQVFYLDNVFESEDSWPFGYYFGGWKVTGIKGTYYKGSTSTNLSANSSPSVTESISTSYKYFKNMTNESGGTVTFTANWVPYSYNISYDVNGYRGVLHSSSATTANYDATFRAYHPSRVGYSFTGWEVMDLADEITHTGNGTNFTSASGLYVESNNPNRPILFKHASNSYTEFKNLHYVQGATVKLIAHWSPNTYTITYHYVTNSTFSGVPTLAQVNNSSKQTSSKTQTLQYDQYFTTYRPVATPTLADEVGFPTGFSMLGWYMSASTISNTDLSTLGTSHMVGTNAEGYLNVEFAGTRSTSSTTMGNLHAYAVYTSVQFKVVYYAPTAQADVNNLEKYVYHSDATVGYGSYYTFPRTRGSVTFTSYMLSPNLYYKGTLNNSITQYSYGGVTYSMAAGANIALGIDNAYAHDPDNPIFYLYGVYDEEFDGSHDKLTITYDSSTYGYKVTDCATPAGHIVIPHMYNDGTHGNLRIGKIDASAFRDINIDSVRFPDGLSYIGNNAFLNALSLGDVVADKVVIPDTVTYLGNSAFDSSGLKYLQIGSGITTLQGHVFYNTNIEYVIIPSSVTTISTHVFSGCTSLKYIYIPSSVTTINASSATNTPFYNVASSCKIYAAVLSKPSGWNTYFNYRASGSAMAVYYGKSAVDFKNAVTGGGVTMVSASAFAEKDDIVYSATEYLRYTIPPKASGKED